MRKTALTETWNGLLDLLYPPKCLVCGRMGPDVLCATCHAGFAPLLPPVCQRCGISTPDPLCPECAAGRPHYFASIRSAGRFEGSLRQAILKLKYGGRRPLAKPLGAFLARMLEADPLRPDRIDLIVPVPLHPARIAERGFNQSALLAREAGRLLDLPVCEKALCRTRRTRPQAELHASQRATNIQDAFAVRDPAPLDGKTVLLIDDVVTTCHTVDECARVLLNAGARVVYVASVARG